MRTWCGLNTDNGVVLSTNFVVPYLPNKHCFSSHPTLRIIQGCGVGVENRRVVGVGSL